MKNQIVSNVKPQRDHNQTNANSATWNSDLIVGWNAISNSIPTREPLAVQFATVRFATSKGLRSTWSLTRQRSAFNVPNAIRHSNVTDTCSNILSSPTWPQVRFRAKYAIHCLSEAGHYAYICSPNIRPRRPETNERMSVTFAENNKNQSQHWEHTFMSTAVRKIGSVHSAGCDSKRRALWMYIPCAMIIIWMVIRRNYFIVTCVAKDSQIYMCWGVMSGYIPARDRSVVRFAVRILEAKLILDNMRLYIRIYGHFNAIFVNIRLRQIVIWGNICSFIRGAEIDWSKM